MYKERPRLGRLRKKDWGREEPVGRIMPSLSVLNSTPRDLGAFRHKRMSEADATIHNISDTARWAAVYRARENERTDAAFRDPYARRLAGERGEAIARSMPFSEDATWAWIARTYSTTSSSRSASAPARTWW